MLEIKNLKVKINNKTILNNINFNFEKGKIYGLMGPNGSGKSTLAWTIMGYPGYDITPQSKIIFQGKDISNLEPEKRAKKGIFLTFQSPLSLTGVNIYQLLNYASAKKIDPLKIKLKLSQFAREINLPEEILSRPLDQGLSGGEKKKMEILQLAFLNPKMIIFDEIDTGMDVDALAQVANFLKVIKNKKTYIFITHYSRIFRYIEPDVILIMKDGKIVKSGDKILVDQIEKEGYQSF